MWPDLGKFTTPLCLIKDFSKPHNLKYLLVMHTRAFVFQSNIFELSYLTNKFNRPYIMITI